MNDGWSGDGDVRKSVQPSHGIHHSNIHWAVVSNQIRCWAKLGPVTCCPPPPSLFIRYALPGRGGVFQARAIDAQRRLQRRRDNRPSWIEFGAKKVKFECRWNLKSEFVCNQKSSGTFGANNFLKWILKILGTPMTLTMVPGTRWCKLFRKRSVWRMATCRRFVSWFRFCLFLLNGPTHYALSATANRGVFFRGVKQTNKHSTTRLLEGFIHRGRYYGDIDHWPIEVGIIVLC